MMNDTATRDTANPAECADYLQAGIAAQAGIEEALRLLQLRRTLGRAPYPNSGVGSDPIQELQTGYAAVGADLVGFLSASFFFCVPERQLSAEIMRTQRALFRMMPDRSSDEILRHALRLLECWRRTRPTPFLLYSGLGT